MVAGAGVDQITGDTRSRSTPLGSAAPFEVLDMTVSKTRLCSRFAATAAVALLLAACATAAPAPAPAPAPAAPAADAATAPDTGVFAGLRTEALLEADLDTVDVSLFDQGKMWTFEFPPVDYLASEYNFRPDAAWFEKARLGALRLPNCSASFVSPNGLVMTNHHCARETVSHVMKPGEDLHENGFFAKNLADERAAGDAFHADQLIELVDVTSLVQGRLTALSEAERGEQREAILETVGDSIAEARGGEGAGVAVEVISLWNGGHYSAYVFRRYHDVRLVVAPETQMGFYGGDPDNFTYPRYNLDFAFYRIYDADGRPLRSPNYFAWDADGARAEEPVFVIGNPGSTTRLQSVAQLEFRRDVSDRGLLDFLRDRVEVLRAFARANPQDAERLDLQNTIFSLENAEKAYAGQIAGVEDVAVLARRLKLEQSFRDSIAAKPALRAEYGGLFEELARLQATKREAAPGFASFLALTADFESATLRRALFAFQLLNAGGSGAPAEALQGLRDELRGVGTQPATLDQALMAARFRDFSRYYGGAPWLQQILAGRPPEAAAAAIHAASVLADSARAVAAVEGGTLTMQDPAVAAVVAYIQPLAAFQESIGGVSAREEEIATRLGRARLEVFGTDVPPDATFSLRIADGAVRGYSYNGTLAPAHTTFYGLYDRYHAFSRRYQDPNQNPWRLPARWRTPPAGLDLATPFNFVSTADIIGGNSGSPVLDRDLRVVGLVFDGNIESLPGDYIYLPELNRSVAVDARAILRTLDHVYDMDRIVVELSTGRLHDTEAAADRARR